MEPQGPNRVALLDALDDARARLLLALDGCAGRLDAALSRDGWTVADVLRHITAWDEAATAGIVALREERPPDVYADDIDQWNSNAVAHRAGRTGDALVEDLHRARRELRDALDQAPDRLWGAPPVPAPNGEPVTIEGIVEVWLDHDHEHAAELESLARRAR